MAAILMVFPAVMWFTRRHPSSSRSGHAGHVLVPPDLSVGRRSCSDKSARGTLLH